MLAAEVAASTRANVLGRRDRDPRRRVLIVIASSSSVLAWLATAADTGGAALTAATAQQPAVRVAVGPAEPGPTVSGAATWTRLWRLGRVQSIFGGLATRGVVNRPLPLPEQSLGRSRPGLSLLARNS
jgi:hypothetical protein